LKSRYSKKALNIVNGKTKAKMLSNFVNHETPFQKVGENENQGNKINAFEHKKSLRKSEAFEGDLAGARTQDPLLKREMLYQLSYQIKKFFIGQLRSFSLIAVAKVRP
tara:strand:- start:6357 stop:6680 length:324 start_codon:yes stop_codon:yes gene_type:complete